MSNAIAILEHGRDLIRDSGWYRGTHGGMALRSVSVPTNPVNGFAGCYCLMTAIDHETEAAEYIFAALDLPFDRDDWTGSPVYELNDSQPADKDGQAWAVSVMERAIDLARGAQPTD